ncbi:MAG TPA: NUDIX domain-containing protein [Treponemataceae bacterium]|nr:NUDIX domain-containing protein [Treponemataceae bacterium]
MKPVSLKFCPQCGSIGYQYRERKYWYCPVCLFTYFHNVATSSSVIIELNGSILMLVRNRDPARGMLSLPGGFVDPDERAEDAAIRECREETGLEASSLSFVGTWPNEYAYKNVLYKTCDLFFAARVPGTLDTLRLDKNEASSFQLVKPQEIDTAPIAFESSRRAIAAWLEQRKP